MPRSFVRPVSWNDTPPNHVATFPILNVFKGSDPALIFASTIKQVILGDERKSWSCGRTK